MRLLTPSLKLTFDLDSFAVHIDDTLRSCTQEGAVITVPEGARQMPRDIRQLERRRAGRLRRAPALTDVSLPARTHQRVSQTDAPARLHLIVTEKRLRPRRRQHSIVSRRRLAVRCRARLQGMEPSDFRRYAVEEVD